MRIISGLAKGRKLETPKGIQIRPTTDRVKESIFNMIAPYISESLVLDLFSGTGSLGLEAISRGAEKVYFVDKSRDSIKLTSKNIINLDMKNRSELINSEAIRAIEDFSSWNLKFDIIFMDPPYGQGIIEPCIMAINNREILNNDGVIVVEHQESESIQSQIGALNILKSKKYGNTIISVYTTGGGVK